MNRLAAFLDDAIRLVGAALLCLLPSKERERWTRRFDGPLGAGGAIVAGAELIGGAWLWCAGFFRFATSVVEFETTTVAAGPVEPRDAVSILTLAGPLTFLAFLISPMGMLATYVVLTGIVRAVAQGAAREIVGEPLITLCFWLWRKMRASPGRVRSARRLGPQRPDRIIAESLGRLTILSCREKPEWNNLATIEVLGRFYRVEGVEEQTDGAWRALAYRLTEYEPHGVIRNLIVYSGEAPAGRAAVGLSIAEGLLVDSIGGPESIQPQASPATPRVLGTDKAETGPDGTIRLSCRTSKGWRSRSPREVHGVGRPGTAVEWDDAWYEVVADEPLHEGGVRYNLTPWRNEHVIRDAVRYDAPTEMFRAERARSRAACERRSKIVTLLAPLTGHLPAAVQEKMHAELGTPLLQLTLISLAPPTMYGVTCLGWQLAQRIRGTPPPAPAFLVMAGFVLLAESFVRLGLLLALNRPAGSLGGAVAYGLYYALKRDRTGLIRPSFIPEIRRAADRRRRSSELNDRYLMIEPYISFLAPEEQLVLRERFGFDPIRWGRRTAWIVLVVTAVGVVAGASSLAAGPGGIGAATSFAAGFALFVEQIRRIATLRKGPAGSFLGVFVRPFARVLLRDARRAGAGSDSEHPSGEIAPSPQSTRMSGSEQRHGEDRRQCGDRRPGPQKLDESDPDPVAAGRLDDD